MTSDDYAAEAARHRHVAEEYRTLSSYAADDGIRRAYLKLADDYEVLANNEDRVAGHLKITH